MRWPEKKKEKKKKQKQNQTGKKNTNKEGPGASEVAFGATSPDPETLQKTKGGEDGSGRLLAAPPGQRSRDPEMICRISCSLVWLSRWLSLLFFALSVFCFSFAGRVLQTIDRPSVGPKPSGSSPFYYVDVKVCYLGGGSLDGGDIASPRCLGPPGSTPEGRGAAHGPRHPAYPLLLRPVISF